MVARCEMRLHQTQADSVRVRGLALVPPGAEHACGWFAASGPAPRGAFFAHGPPFQPEGFCGPLSRFRKEVKDRGGHLFFPFLVDESAGVAMNESSASCAISGRPTRAMCIRMAAPDRKLPCKSAGQSKDEDAGTGRLPRSW